MSTKSLAEEVSEGVKEVHSISALSMLRRRLLRYLFQIMHLNVKKQVVSRVHASWFIWDTVNFEVFYVLSLSTYISSNLPQQYLENFLHRLPYSLCPV